MPRALSGAEAAFVLFFGGCGFSWAREAEPFWADWQALWDWPRLGLGAPGQLSGTGKSNKGKCHEKKGCGAAPGHRANSFA